MNPKHSQIPLVAAIVINYKQQLFFKDHFFLNIDCCVRLVRQVQFTTTPNLKIKYNNKFDN